MILIRLLDKKQYYSLKDSNIKFMTGNTIVTIKTTLFYNRNEVKSCGIALKYWMAKW
jgi:hypothetical protein